MIPVPATAHQVAPYTGRVRTRRKPLVDFHRGAAVMGDPASGLDTHRWTAQYDRATDNVLIYRDDLGIGTAVVEINVPNIKRLVFAFDQNMRAVLAYVLEGGTSTFLRYYVASAGSMQTVEFPGITDPCLTLDDSRELLVTDSDVLMGYTRAGYCYLRAQRDNFTVEYPFGGDGTPLELVAMSMNTQLRIQCTIKAVSYVPPIYVPPPPGYYRYWRVNITASNSHPSIAELEMAETAGGADLTTGGTPIASGSYTGSQHDAANAFNGVLDASDCWAAASAPAGWLGYDFGVPVKIGEVRICGRNSYGQSPRDFTVEHSMNGTDWTADASYTNITVWPAYTLVPFAVPNP